MNVLFYQDRQGREPVMEFIAQLSNAEFTIVDSAIAWISISGKEIQKNVYSLTRTVGKKRVVLLYFKYEEQEMVLTDIFWQTGGSHPLQQGFHLLRAMLRRTAWVQRRKRHDVRRNKAEK